MKSFYKQLLSVISIFSLGIIAYSNTFFCSFYYDDLPFIVLNPAIKNISDLQHIWNFLPCRFILYLSFALNYHFSHLNVFGYHLVNLLVHLGSAIFVWWLTLLTFSTPVMKEERIACHANIIALLAGLVFVAHPIQTESVTYILQRAASMATLFYLASLCLYIKARLLQGEGLASSQGRIYYISSLITAIMAMFIKEITITLPLMILFYEISFFKTKLNFIWKQLLPFLLTILIIPLTMLFTQSSKSISAREMQSVIQGSTQISSMHYLLTQFRVMLTYIRLVFLPFNQNLDYDYPIFKSLFEWPILISYLFLITILFWAKCLYSSNRIVSFFYLFVFFDAVT